jgi:hypothetical protein
MACEDEGRRAGPSGGLSDQSMRPMTGTMAANAGFIFMIVGWTERKRHPPAHAAPE